MNDKKKEVICNGEKTCCHLFYEWSQTPECEVIEGYLEKDSNGYITPGSQCEGIRKCISMQLPCNPG